MSRASELMDSRKFMKAMDRLLEGWISVDNGKTPLASDEHRAEVLQDVLDMANPPKEPVTARQAVLMDQGLLPPKGRGIKALIPVPEMTEAIDAVQQDMLKRHKLSKDMPIAPYPKLKRKRRTKAEMEAAKADPEAPKTRAEARKMFMEQASKTTPEQKARFKAEDERNAPTDPMIALRKAVRDVMKPNWHVIGADGYRSFNIKTVRDGQALSMYPGHWVDALKAEGLHVTMNGQTALMNFQLLNMGKNGNSTADGKQDQWMNVKIA